MMRLRTLVLFPLRLCIVSSLLAIAAPSIAAAQELDATARTAPVDLATGWRVQGGDDPAFASPTFDDSQWPTFDAHNAIGKITPTARPSSGIGCT